MLKKISFSIFLFCPVLLFAQNNVGIGTNSPSERLHVAGNVRADTLKTTSLRLSGSAPAAGKVLTSDANGNATWQTPAGGGGGGTLTDAYNFGGAGAGRIINAATGSLRVDGNYGFQVFGSSSSLSLEDPGPGNRMFFSTSKAAFRSGVVTVQNIWSGDNIGNASSAMGFNSNAAGAFAFAAGSIANANGDNSIAMGTSVVSNADRSATFGFNNINNGYGSLVIGKYNDTLYAKQTAATSGTAMFVVGNGSSALSRNNAMVVLNNGRTGLGTSNPAERLEVEGNVLADTIKTSIVRITGGTPGTGKVLTSDATGNASWQTAAGGGGTLTDAYNFGGPGAGRIINAATASVRIDGSYGLQVSGTYGGATYLENPFTTGGARMFFATSKGALRAGVLTSGAANNLWDRDSVGQASIALGLNSNAWAEGAVAIGYNSFTRGSRAVAMGSGNNANGPESFCAGSSNITTGFYGVAIGFDNSAAVNGVAIGRENTASTSAVAIGINNVSNASGAAAIGNFNQALGLGSVAMGDYNIASSNYSFAAGRFSQASGTHSLTIGESTRARGNWTFAFGRNTESIGNYSGAAGYQSFAKGVLAFAFGEQLVNNGYGSLAVGRFNDSIYATQSVVAGNTALFLVGNGTANNNRNNAFVVLGNGSVGVGLNNPVSAFDIDGTIGMKVRTSSSNLQVTLDNTASVWYLTGTATVQLPLAATFPNRQYTIVNATGFVKNLTTGTPNYFNFSGTAVSTIPANTSITVASDGGNWLRIH